MEFRIDVDVSGMRRKWKLVMDAASDLDEPLRQFGRYLREKSKRRFQAQGPGWPELASSTQERLEHTRVARITASGGLRASAEKAVLRKLRRELKSVPAYQAAKKELDRVLGRSAATGPARALLGTVAEMTRERHNQTLEQLKDDLARHDKKKAGKKRAGKKKAASHRLLGRLASTLRASVRRNLLTVESKVPWAGVHNEGGSAGHGSHIPKRTFLEIDDEDFEVLRHLLGEYLVEEMEG